MHLSRDADVLVGLKADSPWGSGGHPRQNPERGFFSLVPFGLQKQVTFRADLFGVFCRPIHIAAVEDHHLELVGRRVDVFATGLEFFGAQGDPVPLSGKRVSPAGFNVEFESRFSQSHGEVREVMHGRLTSGDHYSLPSAFYGVGHHVFDRLSGVRIGIPAFFDVAPNASHIATAEPDEPARRSRVCTFTLYSGEGLHDGVSGAFTHARRP